MGTNRKKQRTPQQHGRWKRACAVPGTPENARLVAYDLEIKQAKRDRSKLEIVVDGSARGDKAMRAAIVIHEHLRDHPDAKVIHIRP